VVLVILACAGDRVFIIPVIIVIFAASKTIGPCPSSCAMALMSRDTRMGRSPIRYRDEDPNQHEEEDVAVIIIHACTGNHGTHLIVIIVIVVALQL
jgi:hypothetical protein